MLAVLLGGLAAAPLALSVGDHHPSFPLPFTSNFPAFGSWAEQLFPCDASSPNQTASFDASTGLLSLAGNCLGVGGGYSFGQDGNMISVGGCPQKGATAPAPASQRWAHNSTDSTFRSAAHPSICLHASAAQPMASVIQKTCHSVAGRQQAHDPRDQWDIHAATGRISSRANSSLCLDHHSALPPFVCSGETFCNASKPTSQRVADLVSRMDLGEKTIVLNGDNPGVPRLGIPPMVGGDELHGVGGCGAVHGNNTGCGTSFPHALALAATFNRTLWRQVGDAISTENRALTNQGLTGMLNPWDPDINVGSPPLFSRLRGARCICGHIESTHPNLRLHPVYTCMRA